jgi:hypothetical protein
LPFERDLQRYTSVDGVLPASLAELLFDEKASGVWPVAAGLCTLNQVDP